MSIVEINHKLNNLAHAWEQFKTTNERRLGELEKKGFADPLHNEQLTKINKALDEYKQRIDEMEIRMKRPGSADLSYEEKSIFSEYLRKGDTSPEIKSLMVSHDNDGGYFIESKLSNRIVKYIEDISPMRKLCSVETISTSSLDVITELSGAEASWAASESEAVKDTSTPKIERKRIHVHELIAQPKATQRLIDDSSINIDAWLCEKLVEKFAKEENKAFLRGDGKAKPTGILTYATKHNDQQLESFEQKGSITHDSLMHLYYSLQDRYTANCSFLMHRSTIHHIRALKDATGNYIWSPSVQASEPSKIFGVNVYTAADMPEYTRESFIVALGDFKSAYKIVDRKNIRLMRDPYTEKPFIKFYTTKRVGGDVIDFSAIKLLKLI